MFKGTWCLEEKGIAPCDIEKEKSFLGEFKISVYQVDKYQYLCLRISPKMTVNNFEPNAV